MASTWRHAARGFVLLGLILVACTSPRRFYLHSELLKLENDPDLAVAPGPWKAGDVPTVIANTAHVPDDLVLSTLKALMALPGAASACDPNTGRPRADAAEYCVALYRTSEDWRVSWPVRSLAGERSSCMPPFGGVDDEDFGRDLPIFGFAHNHPCGTRPSSPDLAVFPMVKSGDGLWMMVTYGATPSGKLVRDSHGALIPAEHWLATGHRDEPRFYKWNGGGEMFRWNEDMRRWDYQATCRPRTSIRDTGVLPASCTPELN